MILLGTRPTPPADRRPTPPADGADAVSGAEVRGKCREQAEAACEADPTLRLVRGWYYDPIWGREEHWWTERPDGSRYDPTAAQFPVGGVDAWYEEFTGLYPCQHCGREVPELELFSGATCSGRCYGLMVGVLG